MKNFYDVSQRKLIYVFKIDDAAHKGLLKIGDTTFTGDLESDARARIDSYTRTAGIRYDLLLTVPAVTDSGDAFRDYDVHRVLKRFKAKLKGTKAREWFRVDLDTVKRAIHAVKQGKKFFRADKTREEIIFRDEQLDAISRTVEFFKRKGNDKFLWNAKMRFGKTLCALEVVRRMNFGKTIIVTHRPVVDSGWYDDFNKIFRGGTFTYGGKDSDFNALAAGTKNFIYFASIQDLRGSEIVGGKFDKREEIFATPWDCVIVDEAHEGTKTALGDAVISALVKPSTKFLALSGTPFNIIDDFDDDSVFTWDYVDEQRAKAAWEAQHPDESNPYADLPQMNILTYDLGKLLNNPEFIDTQGKTFSFGEFFRTDDADNFAHAADVKKFLDLLVKRDDNNYPFARQEWRDMFRHTLWIVPGVKAGRALSSMLKAHKIFGAFKIVNVAGYGDVDDEPADALDKVRDAIDTHDYTITLSCGKLTAGVTVPEWTAVFMLAGSYSTSAMNYLQTIFRVQTPCKKRGVVKTNCYVFDFAPDRTLKIVAESVAANARAGQTRQSDRDALNEFMKFCPVIAMSGSRMKTFDADKLLGQLKRAYAERAARNGFDDRALYNDELLRLNDLDIDKFKNLGKIIGSSKSQAKRDITINDQGLTDAERKKLRDTLKREPSPEEIEARRRRNQKSNAIKILRGVSIRMPLLIYGADVPLDEDITIERFADLIDDDSWAEFMPAGVTKEIFADFIRFYDRDVFVEAGHRIRQRAKDADELPPAERADKIAALFATFKNPDKETVLTPWRVVDLHLNSLPADIFAPDKKILDINSKTGLYGLWTALKIFSKRIGDFSESDFTPDALRRTWDAVVIDNVYVLCKTPMAVKITRRTLTGYRGGTVNAEFFADLIATLKHTPSTFIERVTKNSFWHKGAGTMFFDAVVGNPPYQTTTSTGNFSPPTYHLFIETAFKLANRVSLIHPARCLFNAGATPKDFNQRLLADPHVKVIRYEQVSSEFFPNTDIKGGVAITYRDANENFGAIDTFTAFDELNTILHKVVVTNPNFQPFSEIVYSKTIYRLTPKFHADNPNAINIISDGHANDFATSLIETFTDLFFDDKPDDGHEYIQVYGRLNGERVCKYFRRDWVNNPPPLTKFKVIVPESNGSGALGEVVSTPLVGSTETFISVGAFDTLAEAQACMLYIKSKFARALLGVLKVTQHNPPATWSKVPLQDFTSASDINWSAGIAAVDAQLYAKYGLTAAEIDFIESNVRAMD
ncbi:MAG: Eco57I restriction-modification methylase domain-containing protein [Quinella sp. 1Q7]|nr:Eco57I restriction-modification methylase domain-containing protein [Quinella sp. 1Q7]